jgi:Porin PorA
VRVRKALSIILIAVGVFCLLLAVGLRFYAPSRAEKTPLNLNITLVSTGPASILNPTTGQVEQANLIATRFVRTDSAKSNSKVTVVQETLCIIRDVDNPPSCGTDNKDPRTLSITLDRVAADRKTGESVNDPKYGENIDGDVNAKHVGLSYKWPFHAKKQTYKFYDPISRQAPDAKYIGTEKLAGLNLYKYQADITNIDLPLPGLNIPAKYSDSRTVWIDPVTGVIVKGTEHQVRTMTDGSPALDTTLTFNQAAINYQAKQAKDGRHKITMLTVVAPLVALVLGIALLIAGGFVWRRTPDRRAEPPAAAASEPPLERV